MLRLQKRHSLSLELPEKTTKWLWRRPSASSSSSNQKASSDEDAHVFPQLPPELWMHIASFLEDGVLCSLYAVNGALFRVAMDKRYRYVGIECRNRYEELSGLIRLFKHMRESSPFVSPRVRHISVTDDILHGFELARKSVVTYPYIFDVPSRHTIHKRIKGILMELRMCPWLIRRSFAHCTNVERLDATFNGPWFRETKKHSGLYNDYYLRDKDVFQSLDILCAAFQPVLREFRLTMLNAANLREMLCAPSFVFPRLEVLVLKLSKHAPHSVPLKHEFAEFVSQFSKTLRVLKVEIDSLGPSPLNAVFHGLPDFPRLETLEVFDHGYNEDAGTHGFPSLSAFLAQPLPRLSDLSLFGPRDIVARDALVLPDRPFVHLALDEYVWTKHAPVLSKHLARHPPEVLTVLCEGDWNGDYSPCTLLCALPPVAIRELELRVVDLCVVRVLDALSALKMLEVLRVEAEWISIEDNPFLSRLIPRNALTDRKATVLRAALRPLVGLYTNTALVALDIVRQPIGIITRDRYNSSCRCKKDMRLWGVMKLVAEVFPSVRLFGGSPGREMREGDEEEEEIDLCEECAFLFASEGVEIEEDA